MYYEAQIRKINRVLVLYPCLIPILSDTYQRSIPQNFENKIMNDMFAIPLRYFRIRLQKLELNLYVSRIDIFHFGKTNTFVTYILGKKSN